MLGRKGLCPAYAPRVSLGRVPARTDQASLGRSSEQRPLSPRRVQYRHRLCVHSLRQTLVTEHGRKVARIVPEAYSLDERLRSLKDGGAMLWSGRRLRKTKPDVRIRGSEPWPASSLRTAGDSALTSG